MVSEIEIEIPDIAEDWYKHPPKRLEDAIQIFNARLAYAGDMTPEGKQLRKIYKWIQRESDSIVKRAKESNPLAFITAIWEQALKLNSWVWGISFKIDFDANRIGKTTCSILDALLWIIPNDPEWVIFKQYVDHINRVVKVLQRPKMESVLKLSNFLKKNPDFKGDPTKQPYDPENAEKFAKLQELFPECFTPAFPAPSFSESENTIWHGAPDADYHDKIVMKEWRKWLPKHVVERDSSYDKTFTLKIQYNDEDENEQTCKWEIVCKSYESADTKWSGAAVTGILLTEGLKSATLNEIKQRFRNDGFGWWDYTPYEARNVGAKTALAHRVFKGKEQMPLSPFVFSGGGIKNIATFVLPQEKKDDQMRIWADKPEGEARLYGKFYSSSPVVLTNLDLEFHTLKWSKEELFSRFPNGNKYRGLDPGFDHPCACSWGLLTPTNTWFIYRIYSKAGTSIAQRCKEIIELSGNSQNKNSWGRGEDDYYFEERHPRLESEVIVQTFADYHTFKTDEVTKQPYSTNYVKEGLILTPSVTMGPRERAQVLDTMLQPSLTKPHPETNKPPGSKIFFLINEEGVAAALEKFENIFWARYSTGDKAGMPKDQIQDHEDDELDAVTYLTCSPVRWTHVSNMRKEPKDEAFATLQNRRSRPRPISQFSITG